MNRKDYVRIAEIIRTTKSTAIAHHNGKDNVLYDDSAVLKHELAILQLLEDGMGRLLSKDNPRFDWQRFQAACTETEIIKCNRT